VEGTDHVTQYERPDPRFSLANERTLLAWNRTALALTAAGLAVTELFGHVAVFGVRRVVGLALIVTGGLVAWASFRRWRAIERSISAGEQLPGTALPAFLTAAVVAASALAIVLAAT
jgi:putative membrane protein